MTADLISNHLCSISPQAADDSHIFTCRSLLSAPWYRLLIVIMAQRHSAFLTAVSQMQGSEADNEVDEASSDEDADVESCSSDEGEDNSDSTSSEEEKCEVADVSASEMILSKDGNIAWKTSNPRVRRTPARNVVHHREGPTIRNEVSHAESFLLFFPDENLLKIVNYTNVFAAAFIQSNPDHWVSERCVPIDVIELKAVIGVLLASEFITHQRNRSILFGLRTWAPHFTVRPSVSSDLCSLHDFYVSMTGKVDQSVVNVTNFVLFEKYGMILCRNVDTAVRSWECDD